MTNVKVAYDAKALLGECPRWDEQTGCLYWVDIPAKQFHRLNPQTAQNETMQFVEEVGCFVLRKNGGFVLAMRSGFHFLDGWNGSLTPIADPEAHIATNRFNDGRCDAAGRFIAGTVYPPKDHGGANLYSLGTDLTVKRIEDNVLTSNGVAFSPDNKTMYFADTPRHTIYAYDYELETGTATNRRTFKEFPLGKGRPDGASVDLEGCYWAALYEGGRVVRISPSGEILQTIEVPAKCPTMVAFGGADLKTLYITSARQRSKAELAEYPLSGAIFSVQVEVAGRSEYRFGG